MALPKIGDGEQVGDGNTNEVLNVGRSGQSLQVGGAASTLIAFHGASPVDQAAFIATQSINALSVSGVVGFTSSTSLSSLVSKVNSIVDALVEKGLLASS